MKSGRPKRSGLCCGSHALVDRVERPAHLVGEQPVHRRLDDRRATRAAAPRPRPVRPCAARTSPRAWSVEARDQTSSASDRLARVLGDSLGLGRACPARTSASASLRSASTRKPLLLRRAEPPHRVAQQLLGALDVAAPQLERAEHRVRPAGAARGARLLERREPLAQRRLGELEVVRLAWRSGRPSLAPAERLAAAALERQRGRTARSARAPPRRRPETLATPASCVSAMLSRSRRPVARASATVASPCRRDASASPTHQAIVASSDRAS